MTKPFVTYFDAERLVRDYLDAEVPDYDPQPGDAPTVTIGLPHTWTPSSPSHIQVEFDGTPDLDHPVAAHPTVRITAWAANPTRAKQLAHLCLGLLCGHPGGAGISGIWPLTGVFTARDEDNGAELASVTVRVTVRSIPLTPAGS